MLALALIALAAVSSAEVLEDPRSALTAAEVWSSPAFEPLAPGGVNVGYTSSAYWLRLRMTGEGPCVLDLTSTMLEAELYDAPDAAARRISPVQPPSRREVPAARVAFRVPLAPGEERQVLVRIRSGDTLALMPRLVPEPEFWRDQLRERAEHGIYYGIIFALIAYNLFLFLGTRERAYLAYALFQSAFAMGQASFDKHAFDLLWPSHPVWAARSEQVFGALSAITALVFVRIFLGTKGRLDLVLRALAAANAILGAAACFTEHDVLKWILGVLLLSSIVTMAVAAVHAALRTRATEARIFAIAWSVLLVATALSVMAALGMIGSVQVAIQVFSLMKVGSAAEAILLSLALAGRINALRREREAAQRGFLRAKLARLEALSTLVSGVAHEIGNPLNFARGGAEELARRLDDGDLPAARRAGALVLSGMNRIKRILDNLRSYLRTGDVEEVPTDLGQEIAAALDLMSERMAGIRVERRLGELPPVRVRPGELHQVLVNLLTNAVQAMPEGGELTIEAAVRGASVEIAVEDTGPGVDPARRDTIFEPFYTTRGADGGTGLGLAVAREIVLRHGGSIRVEDGRAGARFVVSLPIS